MKLLDGLQNASIRISTMRKKEETNTRAHEHISTWMAWNGMVLALHLTCCIRYIRHVLIVKILYARRFYVSFSAPTDQPTDRAPATTYSTMHKSAMTTIDLGISESVCTCIVSSSGGSSSSISVLVICMHFRLTLWAKFNKIKFRNAINKLMNKESPTWVLWFEFPLFPANFIDFTWALSSLRGSALFLALASAFVLNIDFGACFENGFLASLVPNYTWNRLNYLATAQYSIRSWCFYAATRKLSHFCFGANLAIHISSLRSLALALAFENFKRLLGLFIAKPNTLRTVMLCVSLCQPVLTRYIWIINDFLMAQVNGFHIVNKHLMLLSHIRL